ncbi:hypothetical protein QN224_06905 [Sinorhizobium sp. 8-89]|uniref:hypothetical protein n=1 Tax=Sinorhizobium sp. 7-81 TaxID=3049087 RepID=UPI0024C2998D|nr:hypothetical protein [Sinorhizobium sp. 7-81]MDK1385133.1 hypothetical protein [Sinorhizobium sp. 7-81]
MSASGKTVYRVKQLVAHDVAIIAEVKDGEAHRGKLRETRDSRIALGGTDSFWLIGGEKKESKLVVQKDDISVPVFASGISSMASKIRASSVFELPKVVNDNAGPGKFDAVSFTTVTRLTVGYSPHGGSEELLPALSKGTLHIPLEAPVSAIEVRPGHWLTSGFEALPAGRYGLRQQSLRSVATASLENRPDMIRLANGLVVFVSPPKWSEPKSTDLRSEEEIHESVERWLSRSTAALSLPGDAGSLEPAELLRLLADRAISEEEKADLASIAGRLSKRSELADILPEILGRDPAFRDRLAGFEESEKARLRTELEEQLRREMEVERARLAALRIEVADAETKLASFSHREALLRSETEKHEEMLRSRIASAAEGIRNESSRETAAIRDEVARLRDDMAQIATAVPAAAEPVAEARTEESIPAAPPPRFASDEQRQKTLNELAVATGLTLAEVAAIVATATDVVPVLLGPDSAAAAVDIATAFAGDDAAIVFCDPTKISLTDLLNDEHSGLREAIDKAKERPEALYAAAICGITSGPCEYWLPQIIAMRRVGRLPRNLALVASAGADGLRVPIPDSTLRHLFPLKPSKAPRPGSAKFEGLWPMTNLDQERVREVVEVLAGRELEGSAMQAVARALARTPSWMQLSDAVLVFLRQAKWLAAIAAGHEHEHDEYFIDMEG